MRTDRRLNELVRLYGPLASFVLVLMLVVALVPATHDGRKVAAGGPLGAESGAATGTGEAGGTGAQGPDAAAAAGAASGSSGGGATASAASAAAGGLPPGAASG